MPNAIPLASLNEELLSLFQKERQRTDRIFGIADPSAYDTAPIPLRHPLVFYDGHVDAFNWNVLFRKILKKPSFNPEFDSLFARGIDPKSQEEANRLAIKNWPSREDVESYKQEINCQFYEYLSSLNFSKQDHPLFKNGLIFFLLLEHELTHQETLLYMIHQLPDSKKHKFSLEFESSNLTQETPSLPSPEPFMVSIPAGKTYLGTTFGEFDFGWDNEFDGDWAHVDAFEIDAYPVTNEQFLSFIEAGGYQNKKYWTEKNWAWRESNHKTHPHYWVNKKNQWFYKGLFKEVILPLSWPVYVTHAEAEAYAQFAEKSLPNEAQWHRSAYGESKNIYPWGNEALDNKFSNAHYIQGAPSPVNRHPKGVSLFGVYDLCGNGWEWTSTPFSPFKGFEASQGYPQYSADFFDGEHFVMKGGSYATHQRLLRRSFRNWFYWDYPYMYTTFRCIREAKG